VPGDTLCFVGDLLSGDRQTPPLIGCGALGWRPLVNEELVPTLLSMSSFPSSRLKLTSKGSDAVPTLAPVLPDAASALAAAHGSDAASAPPPSAAAAPSAEAARAVVPAQMPVEMSADIDQPPAAAANWLAGTKLTLAGQWPPPPPEEMPRPRRSPPPSSTTVP
jgi:hypothetical protein